jgi:hypothetical protein
MQQKISQGNWRQTKLFADEGKHTDQLDPKMHVRWNK